MKYAYVENGVVKETNRPLPVNWKNFSNFNLLDNETLKDFGWIPYKYIYCENKPEKWIQAESYFEITDDYVIEYERVREKTNEEIESEKMSEWINVKSRRNIELKESDWTQLSDISQSTKDLWSTYRQELRQITNQSNPFNIEWPVKP
jgi:hypothetical protein